jgi:hypothetical protein
VFIKVATPYRESVREAEQFLLGPLR